MRFSLVALCTLGTFAIPALTRSTPTTPNSNSASIDRARNPWNSIDSHSTSNWTKSNCQSQQLAPTSRADNWHNPSTSESGARVSQSSSPLRNGNNATFSPTLLYRTVRLSAEAFDRPGILQIPAKNSRSRSSLVWHQTRLAPGCGRSIV